ncbi:hypothetical protein GCM10022378_16120 [Salinicoccus jeotgali]|uniref:DUF6602 domain-containing protein n=1 Tax=Salinicoccus jeotgali TaxID=381634 RepID=A0ABP7F4D4_9STAP
MTSIKALLDNKQKALTAKLESVISHPTSKGDNSESAWINFFRSFLPSKYSIDKGFIFDSTGKISEQIDIIIYDALYAPLIFETETGEKYITAESVYAVFEVKQKINKYQLEYAHHKIMSVKNLCRSSRPMIVAGNYVAARDLTKIIGGIISSNSIKFNSIKDYLSLYPSIDLGCAINSFSFLTIKDDDENLLDIKKSNDDEVILSFFFIILDELYKIGTVPALDIRNYANSSLEGLKLERGI